MTKAQAWYDTYWFGFIAGLSVMAVPVVVIYFKYSHLTFWGSSTGRMLCVW